MDERLLELELGIRMQSEFGTPLFETKNPFGDDYSPKYNIEKEIKEDYLKRIEEDSE